MRIYGDRNSGNCLKVKFVADHLGLPYAWTDVDVAAGGAKAPDYLARFPMGQVPGVEFDDGRRLAQSNAIVRYLARGSALLPEDAFAQGEIDAWLFWEQYSHEPYVAVCRYQMRYLGRPREAREAWRVERGEAALDLMDGHLAGRDWFVGEGVTIADVALLAYTRLAHEGGFALADRPALRGWVARVETALGLHAAPDTVP